MQEWGVSQDWANNRQGLTIRKQSFKETLKQLVDAINLDKETQQGKHVPAHANQDKAKEKENGANSF